MVMYKNSNGDSGVRSYEIGVDYIDVQFSTGKIYRYSYQSAGKQNIEQMKRLAQSGSGLNSFINTKVRNLYVK
jgi:hypothetical protein